MCKYLKKTKVLPTSVDLVRLLAGIRILIAALKHF